MLVPQPDPARLGRVYLPYFQVGWSHLAQRQKWLAQPQFPVVRGPSENLCITLGYLTGLQLAVYPMRDAREWLDTEITAELSDLLPLLRLVYGPWHPQMLPQERIFPSAEVWRAATTTVLAKVERLLAPVSRVCSLSNV